jgi:hypothetical protein
MTVFGRASGGAYDEWQARLARVGPRRTTLGMSRLARVRVCDVVTRRDSVTWAMRWEVPGRRAALVPALDAGIKLTSDGQEAALLAVSAVCRRRLQAWTRNWTRPSYTASPRQRSRLSPTASQQLSRLPRSRCSPIRWASIRRNEVTSTVTLDRVRGAMADPAQRGANSTGGGDGF